MTTDSTKHGILASWVFADLPASPKLGMRTGTDTPELVDIDVSNDREFWLSGDHHPNALDESGVGRGDLICILEQALNNNAAGKVFTVTLNAAKTVTISTGDSSDFSILWSHGGASGISGELWGFTNDRTESTSGTVTSTSTAYGWWLVDRPMTIDSRNAAPAAKAVATTKTGLTETTFFSEERDRRTAQYNRVPEAFIIEAEATHKYNSFAYYWRTSIGRGYALRVYRDRTLHTAGQFETYRATGTEIPYNREEPQQLRWSLNLPLRLTTPQQALNYLTQHLTSMAAQPTDRFTFLDSASTFTLAGYTKTAATTQQGIINRASYVDWGLTSAGKLRLTFTTGNYVETNSALADGEWHKWAVVYDGTQTAPTDKVKLYMDGVLQARTATGTIPASTTASQSSETYTMFETQAMSQLGFWREALSADQLSAMYNGGMPFDWSAMWTVPKPINLYRLNGDLTDDMGTNNLAVRTGTETYDDADWPGKCSTGFVVDAYSLRLNDDTDAAGSYVALGDLDTLNNATSFSVSWWFKFETTISGNTGWFIGTTGVSTAYGKLRIDHANASYVDVIMPNSSGQLNNITRFTWGTMSADTWYHFCITFDGSNGMEGYRDGVAGTESQVSGSLQSSLQIHSNNTDATWIMGGNWTGSAVNQTFNGANIFQPVIYDAELSSSQVGDIYNSGTPVALETLDSWSDALHRWKMDTLATGYATLTDDVGGANGTYTLGASGDVELDSP